MKITSFLILAVGFNVRVRRGFAQIWCLDPFEPMADYAVISFPDSRSPVPPFPHSSFLVSPSSFLVLRFLFSFPCSPSPVLRSSFSVSRSPLLALHSSFLVLRSPYSVPRTPFLILRFPFSVPHTPLFPILRSSFSVPRSLFSALSLPFPVPRSSNFVARSPFLVEVKSYYCYDTTVVISNSDFRNISVP